MNVYIYSNESYNPGSNTLAYYPLTSTTTVNDMSGNNHHLTNAGKVNFGVYGGVDCAYFSSGQNSGLSGLYRLNDQIAYDGMTISAWFKRVTPMLHNPRILGVPNDNVWLALNYDTAQTTYNGYWNLSSTTDASRQIALSTNDWCNIIIRYSTSARIAYYNGVKTATAAGAGSSSLGTGIIIGSPYNRSAAGDKYNGYMSELIIEKGDWTDSEALNYFNSNKSRYGL